MTQRSLHCLAALVLFIGLASLIEGTGFPSGGGGCCGGGGGGGGGCGCGRKKRDAAVQPHYKADETPCPQTAWKQVLEEGIVADDAIASVNAIQTGLFRRYEDHKFLVVCSTADEAKSGTATANKVHFSSSGDGYCNVVKERVWCQAVSLSA